MPICEISLGQIKKASAYVVLYLSPLEDVAIGQSTGCLSFQSQAHLETWDERLSKTDSLLIKARKSLFLPESHALSWRVGLKLLSDTGYFCLNVKNVYWRFAWRVKGLASQISLEKYLLCALGCRVLPEKSQKGKFYSQRPVKFRRNQVSCWGFSASFLWKMQSWSWNNAPCFLGKLWQNERKGRSSILLGLFMGKILFSWLPPVPMSSSVLWEMGEKPRMRTPPWRRLQSHKGDNIELKIRRTQNNRWI